MLLGVLAYRHAPFLSYFCQDYTVASRRGKICFQTQIIDFVGSGIPTLYAIKYITLLSAAFAVLVILYATAYFQQNFKQMPGLQIVIK